MSDRVHLVWPSGIDDPARPSGGNQYDRRIGTELRRRGWRVIQHQAGPDQLKALLADQPDDELVVLDGLIAIDPAVLVPASERLRLLVLVHLPHGIEPAARPAEAAVLTAAAGVITTSGWTRQWLQAHYRLASWRIRAAEPGADPAALSIGTEAGTRLLCVAAVASHKGQDVLAAALAELTDRAWTCRCIGPMDRDPGFTAALQDRLTRTGLTGRMTLTGPADPTTVGRAYAGSDVLVLPSRAETYGMVVTEALAHGLPVIASGVGGVPEALGVDPAGRRPGLLVPADDPAALATALRTWLDEADLRARLRRSARQRRAGLLGWDRTAERFSHALTAVVNRDRSPSVSLSG